MSEALPPQDLPRRRPRPWDLDAARTSGIVLAAGLALSALLHGGIPLAGVFWPVKSISQLPVTIEFEAMPLPPAEELVESPDDVDADGSDEPDAPDVDSDTVEPTPTPPEPDAPDAADDGDDVDDTDVADAPPPEDALPPVDAPLPTTNEELQKRIAERNAKREAWLADRAKRLAERQARREARRRAAEEARRKRKGGAPEGGSDEGNPEAVYLCEADGRGQELQPRTERPITSWVGIVPTVFAHFDTRPNLGGYISRLNQVYVPRKRLGLVDFAAPMEVLQMKMEDGSTIAVGRLDVRCMIGLRFSAGGRYFPIKLTRLPARIIDKRNKSVSALIDLMIYKDASVEVRPFDRNQPELPYTRNRFKNGSAITRNIDDHIQAARLAKSLADLFGFKPERKPTIRESTRKKTNGTNKKAEARKASR